MLTLKNIIETLGCVEFHGNPDVQINEIVQLDSKNTHAGSIGWCSDKNIHALPEMQIGSYICSSKAMALNLNSACQFIVVENPRLYFARVVNQFFYTPPVRHGISPSASIDPSSEIGKNCYIGSHVVIEENCRIGDNCYIDHGTVIHHGTVIKNNVKIGCNNVIGGFGYGYEKNEQGEHEPIPHTGNVLIEEGVEICNNSCIDRAAMGSTRIGRHVKISNLVHIGHGVDIGSHSLIIANAMIAGSTTIGENVWISPSASIINKTSVGDHAVVGLSAVVLKPVKNNTVVAGNPARELQPR